MAGKIIICDDDEGIRESLKLLIGDHFPTILVEDGMQCLECLKNFSHDIAMVFLDIKMPRMNGLEVLDQIKKEWPKIPVALVTGYRTADVTREAASRGANAYIFKPFEKEEIFDSIKRCLGKDLKPA